MAPVNRDFLAYRTAEEIINRYVQRLPLDIEQGVFNRRDRLLIDAARRLAGLGVKKLVYAFVRHGVHADYPVDQAPDHGGQAGAAVTLVIFGDTGDAFVCDQLEEAKISPAGVAMPDLATGDAHGTAPGI